MPHMLNPISGEVKIVSREEAHRLYRYGWRFANAQQRRMAKVKALLRVINSKPSEGKV